MVLPANKTKIVCTIGPASSSRDVLRKLILAGMNVARLNFSHGSHETHRQLVRAIRSVSERLGKPVAILQDLQGPVPLFTDHNFPSLDLNHGNIFTPDIRPV